MEKPLVSIIVLNLNGQSFLIGCLDSLKKQTYQNIETIVVDNGSTDNSIKIITEQYRDFVKVICNEKNLGFAKGNNIGILQSKGDYIFILNNDTVIDRYCIQELVETAENESAVGMFAPKIIFLQRPNIIDCVGINIFKDGTSQGRGYLEIDNNQYNKKEEILLPSGTAALYRKQMLDETGLFDEDFFIYCEDTDLGLRGRLAGWKALYVPLSIVYHYYSGTVGGHSPFKAYLVERNHFWVVVKTFPLCLVINLLFYTLYRYLTQIYGMVRNKGKVAAFVSDFSMFYLFTILIKAWIGASIKLPVMFQKRRKIFAYKKTHNRDMLYLFNKYSLNIKDLIL